MDDRLFLEVMYEASGDDLIATSGERARWTTSILGRKSLSDYLHDLLVALLWHISLADRSNG